MTSTTSNTARAWLPQQIEELIVKPLREASVAARIGVYKTGLTGESFRVPIVAKDPSAAWVAEGAEIPVSEAELAEAIATYRKLAGLHIVSRELAEDSDPSAIDAIGQGLVHDLARKLDLALFGDGGAEAPAGLAKLTGFTSVEAPDTLTNLDPFIRARFRAASVGAEVAAYVLHPDDGETLALLKESSSSAKALLTEAAGRPGTLAIDGVPVELSPALTPGISWALPKRGVHIGIRQDATVDVDHSAFFTSDRIAVRGTLRAGFAFSHPEAVIQIVRPSALVAG